MRKQRLKAFTLIELTVVMIISGIVASIAIAAFGIVQRQFVNYERTSRTILQLHQLDMLLANDFLNSAFIRKSSEGIEVANKHDELINYYFHGGFIVRERAAARDTFYAVNRNLQMNLLRQKQEKAGELIDELSFEVRENKENNYFHYTKMYGADVLMQLPARE